MKPSGTDTKRNSHKELNDPPTPDYHLRVRRGIPTDAETLSALCLRSKSYWRYDKAYLIASAPLLKITPEYISTWPVFVCESGGHIVGFASLTEKNNVSWLDNLWVEPLHIGRGIGRFLFLASLGHAKKHQLTPLRIAADPGAEGFYKKMGAGRIGMMASRIAGGPQFPILEVS